MIIITSYCNSQINKSLSKTIKNFRFLTEFSPKIAKMDQNMEEIVKNFHKNGIGLVKGFASKDECKVMIEKMKEIINNTNMKDRVYIAFFPINR